MEKIRKYAARMTVIMLTAVMMSGALASEAFAAAKKTVYVVSSIKVNDGSDTYTTKISYKKGFLKKISDKKEERKFTYNKKYQVKKMVDIIKTGPYKGTETTTYTWKKGVMTKKVTEGIEKNVYTLKSNKKGQIISMEESWSGAYGAGVSMTTYKYKKGHVVTENNGNVITSYAMDKNGNIVKAETVIDGKKFDQYWYNAKITYKKGRVKKMVTRRKNPMMEKEEKLTMTVSWKKVKVAKKYVSAIKEQQWKLLNGVGISYAW